MKKRRLFENVVEFLLLCLVLFLYFKLMTDSMSREYSDSGGKDIALGFGVATLLIYVIEYLLTFIVNLLLQSIFLISSSKSGKRYYWNKIMLFAVTLLIVLPLLRFAFEHFEYTWVIDFYFCVSVFISSLNVSFLFFIPYLIIITLFYFFDKKHKIKKYPIEDIEKTETTWIE